VIPLPTWIEQARSGRYQLDDAHLLADRAVEVNVEADHLGVERLGAVHIKDGYQHHFKGPVQGRILLAINATGSRAEFPAPPLSIAPLFSIFNSFLL
jgi:hypothetical protein